MGIIYFYQKGAISWSQYASVYGNRGIPCPAPKDISSPPPPGLQISLLSGVVSVDKLCVICFEFSFSYQFKTVAERM